MASFSYPVGIMWLMIISGAESFLSYDHEGQKLRFQCSKPPSMTSPHALIQAKVSRVSVNGRKPTTLADWRNKEKGESLHDRVRVMDVSTEYLEATLEHVTCYDSTTYTYQCVITVDSMPTKIFTYNQSFQFIGQATPPHITQEPLKSRYKEGELISLNCTASLGASDNGLVWEAGFLGGNFSRVTGEANPDTGKAYEEVQRLFPDCIRQSHLPLRYRVRAKDDGKVFQCRLLKDGQTTRVAIAVQRDRETICSRGLQRDRTDPETNLQAGQPKYGQISGEKGDDADVGNTTPSYWPIIVVVIMSAMVIVIVATFIVLRKRSRKQPPPLVIIESPGPATSSESGYSDRRLPSLPDLNDATTPKWITDAQHPHLDNPYHPAYPTLGSSVYVSMTAIDRCAGAGDHGTEEKGNAHVPAEKEVEDMFPDMRRERSETMYSNQSAIEQESCKTAAAAATAATAAAAVPAATAAAAVTAAPIVTSDAIAGSDACLGELK